jgi:putative flippase GtrA
MGTGLTRGTIKVPLLRDDGPPGPAGPRTRLAWQLPRFIGIGVASTLAYTVLYMALRTFLPALAANLLSLLLTAVGNTAANRRLTFGIRGREGAAAHQARGLIAFATGLLLTSGALMALHAGDPHAGKAAELAVLVAANLVATMSRFVLYRGWVFGRMPDSDTTAPSTLPIHSSGSTR